MTKSEHLEYWKRMALRDWETVIALQAAKQNIQALFFVHLVIEKLLKAHFVKDNQENTPPLTHNLEGLYNQTKLNLLPVFVERLSIINGWNIEGRYQDYMDKFYKLCTDDYVGRKIIESKELMTCLIQELP
jgi:HEPN domain-containing protein